MGFRVRSLGGKVLVVCTEVVGVEHGLPQLLGRR